MFLQPDITVLPTQLLRVKVYIAEIFQQRGAYICMWYHNRMQIGKRRVKLHMSDVYTTLSK